MSRNDGERQQEQIDPVQIDDQNKHNTLLQKGQKDIRFVSVRHTRMEELISKIALIGKRMVACTSSCDGIRQDQSAGVPPRCLILESEGRLSSNGCAVIGINPGNASPEEIKFYKANGVTYDVLLKYWSQSIGYSHQYYTQVRKFLNQVGLSGPILWTELAKCEGATKTQKVPSLSTLRYCAGQFLLEELQLIPQWPLIALGREAYKALSYMYPRRTIIGLPHPTGMGGRIQFSRFMPGGVLLVNTANVVRSILAAPPGRLEWISHTTNPVDPVPPD